MKKLFYRTTRYVQYLLKAKGKHSLHSPFMYEFYTEIIKSNKKYYAFESIEKLRTQLANNHQKILVRDFGTSHALKQKKISNIVLYSEKNANTASLLFRMVHYFKPNIIIDLGTSLGLTTAYLASASSQSKVYTFEGCENTLSIAKENFSRLNLQNIQPILGNIDETLEPLLTQLPKVDFVFFDANHRYKPTLNYFEQCLSKAHEDTVFVFDDIYWSQEMTKAWYKIIAHRHVRLSIDLYELGIIFFRKKQPVQHFVLKW